MNVTSIRAFENANQRNFTQKHTNLSFNSNGGVSNTVLSALDGANALAGINSAQLYLQEATKKSPNILAISFTGNPDKNIKQMISIGPENKGLKMNYVYSQGGLGVVTHELPDVLKKYRDIDVRSITPYHCPDIKRAKGEEIEYGLIKVMKEFFEPDKITGEKKLVKREFRVEKTDYTLTDNESFVINAPLNSKDQNNLNVGFIKLKPTGIQGNVKALSNSLDEMKNYPYILFEADIFDGQELQDKARQYILHVPGMDEWEKAYNMKNAKEAEKAVEEAAQEAGNAVKKEAKKVTSAYAGGFTEDYFYSVFDKAALDATKQMSINEEFIKKAKENGEEVFIPANIMLHDRQAFPAALDVANRSAKGDEYFHGFRMVDIEHNPTSEYQGSFINPIDYFKIVGTEDQLNDLKTNHPKEYKELCRLNKKILEKNKQQIFDLKEIFSEEELKKAKEILDPYIGHFKDDAGAYNLTTIPIEMLKAGNSTKIVTVSENFADEMKHPGKTKDIVGPLATRFQETEILGITNGITPANMGFEKDGKIGKGILNSEEHIQIMKEAQQKGLIDSSSSIKYIPTKLGNEIREYKAPVANIMAKGSKPKTLNQLVEEFYNIRQSEKEWLINSIFVASKQTEELKAAGKLLEGELTPLEALFLDKDLKNSGASILGKFSKFSPGDILLSGRGRQTKQKGMVTTLEAMKEFLMDSNIPEKIKLHTKLLLGTGVGAWNTKEQDWKDIVKFFEWLQEYEGGKYSGNACYVNGFLPNKLSICADFGAYTSDYEPCGLTFVEDSTGGTPSISTNTGGAPNYIKNYNGENIKEATGFLTKDAFSSNIAILYDISKEDARKLINKTVQTIKEELKTAGEELPSETEIRAMAKRRLRVNKISEQICDQMKIAIDVFNNKPEDYKQMVANNLKLKTDWHENGWTNKKLGSKSAVDCYLEAFGLEVKSIESYEPGQNPVATYQELFKRKHSPMKSLNPTPVVSTKQVIEAYTPVANETVKKVQREFALSKTGKIGIIVAGTLAALGGLVAYCDRYEKRAMEQNAENK